VLQTLGTSKLSILVNFFYQGSLMQSSRFLAYIYPHHLLPDIWLVIFFRTYPPYPALGILIESMTIVKIICFRHKFVSWNLNLASKKQAYKKAQKYVSWFFGWPLPKWLLVTLSLFLITKNTIFRKLFYTIIAEFNRLIFQWGAYSFSSLFILDVAT